ncbi:MAG: hypothetical protein IKR86_09520 [Candidatus Methanomethylophilaceae archaeon]|nr:hypothetical protein [Candidatus Methanomethylophilaceae archaeon]
MASMRNALAVVGLISIIAVSCIAVGLLIANEEPSKPPDDWSADASTDGLTYSQIQSKLNHYAEILNTKDAYLVLSGDVWSQSYGSSVISTTSGNTVTPVPGSAKVVDGDLMITTKLRSYSGGTSSYTNYDLIIPYHSIVAIKIPST